MDFITLFVFSAFGLIILAAIITRISKVQIENKATLKEISDAVMDFDKIDELKRKNLPLKYFAKLQKVEQQTIESKLVAAENLEDLFFLYERAQSLTSKAVKKNIEIAFVQVINAELRHFASLPAPDQTGKTLKDLYLLEKYMKNITDADTEKAIYGLKKKHTIVSETMRVNLVKLAETN